MTARILTGDALEMLKTLPDQSVQCAVSSPPYFNLRSYLPTGHEDKRHEIGAEPSPATYVENLVAVFREVRRVLRDDGVAWLNLGDSFSSSPPGNKTNGVSAASGLNGVNSRSGVYRETLSAGHATKRDTSKIDGVKPKDLLGIPWAVALALRAGFSRCSGCATELRTDLWPVWKGRRFCPDCPQAKIEKSEEGWYLRRDIIWSKDSCLPESVQDRCTSSHEYVFMLTKRPSYFYDSFAIAEPADGTTVHDLTGQGYKAPGQAEHKGNEKALSEPATTRNKRSVWRINPEPFADAHFGTMPTALAEVCIKAGSSEVGACRHCGAPWERIVEKGEPDRDWQRRAGADLGGSYAGQSRKGHDTAGVQNASDVKRRILEGMCEKFTAGWRMTCSCPVAKPVPCVVLDPFAGAGTTLLVSERMGRDSIGIELNPEYVRMARKRIIDDLPMFADVRAA